MEPEFNPIISTNSALPSNLDFLSSFLSPDFISKALAVIATSSLVTLLFTRYFEVMSDKKKLFADAYKAAMAWQEMLYRVRRRAPGVVEEQKLVERFHQLQEEINYYQGLVFTESEVLGLSYDRFVNHVKKENKQLIQEAWESPIRRPKLGVIKTSKYPNTTKAGKAFLRDTRNWFSFWQVPKLFVLWRNWRYK